MAGRSGRRLIRAGEDAAAQRQAVLVQVARSLSESVEDPRRLAGMVVDAFAALVGDEVTMWVLNPDGSAMECAGVGHRDPDALRMLTSIVGGMRYERGDGLLWPTVESGRPTLTPHFSLDDNRNDANTEILPYMERYGVHSIAVSPVSARGRVIAVIGASRTRLGGVHRGRRELHAGPRRPRRDRAGPRPAARRRPRRPGRTARHRPAGRPGLGRDHLDRSGVADRELERRRRDHLRPLRGGGRGCAARRAARHLVPASRRCPDHGHGGPGGVAVARRLERRAAGAAGGRQAHRGHLLDDREDRRRRRPDRRGAGEPGHVRVPRARRP